MTTAKTRKRTPMSDVHKAALSRGRDEGRTVRHYLDALENNRPKRGRRRTPESVQRRLEAANERLASANTLTRLRLMQELTDLEAELNRKVEIDNQGDLEKEFIKVAKDYGERKGIGYNAWRAMKVPANVLRDAGISRADKG